MKVIFFGTPEIATPFLKMLIGDDRIEVVGVVTMPDKPVGRKQIIEKSPVKKLAEENDLKIFQPSKLDNDFAEELQELKPDFNVVISYGHILPKSILDMPKFASVNIHFSLLPHYRGASPVQSALLNGDKETGISLIKMSEKMDEGDIYLIKKVEISEDENAETLLKRLADLGAILIGPALRDIADDVLTPIPQDHSKATFCHKISKEDAQIDLLKNSAEQILNKSRAFYPWPGIFMIYKDKRLKLINIEKSDINTDAGNLVKIDGALILGTSNGSLKITKLQPEGKKSMSDKDFMNGFL